MIGDIISFYFKSANTTSGVHRLFEGQGWKEKKGHIQRTLATEEGTLALVFATQGSILSCFNEGGSLVGFADQEGTLARVSAPNGPL